MEYKIELPILEDLGGYKEILYIDSSSKKNQKQALEDIARYFKKEFRYDFFQYSIHDPDPDLLGILFLEQAWDLVEEGNHFPNRVIGGACFRKIKSREQCLNWIWLHPFSRNRGKLKEYWPKFKAKFGAFEVTKPLSAHMEQFIKKHA